MPCGNARPWPSDAILNALIEVLGSRPGITAGDWNEAPNYPAEADPQTRAWFERAESAGWVEAVSTAFGGPVRTNFAATRNARTRMTTSL